MVTWTGDDTFVLGDAEYVCRPLADRFPSTADRLCLVKHRWQVEWYEQFLRDLAPQRMIEVGMWDGASMALCAELVHPRLLVGIDNREVPSSALHEFIAHRRLEGSVRPYYGVDQADTRRLGEIVFGEFGDEKVDLIVDDASHLLEPTRITFNRLFPRLRPGGVYVIEDWPMHQLKQVEHSLTLLVFEAILACAESPATVANVSLNQGFAIVTRGDANVREGFFDLANCYSARARALLQQRTGVDVVTVPDAGVPRRRAAARVPRGRWQPVPHRAARVNSD